MADKDEVKHLPQNVQLRHQTILDNISDMVWLKDRGSRYIIVNQAFGQASGCDPRTLVGKTDLDVWPEDLAKKYQADDREVMATGRQICFEEPVVDKQGRRAWLETIKKPIFDDQGWIIGTTGIARDITERKRKEMELQSALNKLEDTKDMLAQFEKQAAMGRLAASLSHEILNPLTVISSRLQLLESSSESTADVRATLAVCREQIRRIVKIARDLHLSSQTGKLQLMPVELGMIIRQALHLMDSRLKSEHIHCKLSLSPDIPPLCLDRDKMERLFVNLIGNAVDAMSGKDNKIIEISMQWHERAAVGEQVRLTIADTGTGISGENMSKIFDPFFTTKDPGKGTGLGLSICHGITQEHGGRIWVENNDRGGATFFVDIPVNNRSAAR